MLVASVSHCCYKSKIKKPGDCRGQVFAGFRTADSPTRPEGHAYRKKRSYFPLGHKCDYLAVW